MDDGNPYRITVDGDEVIIFGDPTAPETGNVDVEVIEQGGRRWSASFFTLDGVDWLFRKNATTGENAAGLYLWSVDMILVRELSEDVIRRTISDLKASGKFESAFGALAD